MKGIVKKATAVVLAVTVMCGTVMGISVTASAASLSAGAALAGESLSFLESLFMAGGMSLGLDMILKTQNDINNWDWGELLDDPLTQDQLKDAEDKIGKLYYGATEAYKKTHGNGSGTTPSPAPTSSPDISPPVTVAPINPDDLDIPEDWATLKKNATDKGILAMGAATAYCVKEAVKGWWDDLSRYSIGNTELTVDDTARDLINKNADSFPYYVYTEYHWKNGNYGTAVTKQLTFLGEGSCVGYVSRYGELYVYHVGHCENYRNDYNEGVESPLSFYMNINPKTYQRSYYAIDGATGYRTNLPIFQNENDAIAYVNDYLNTKKRKFPKTSLWPSTELKDDYDNNKSPNLPELVAPALRLPTLDEIKDLWKQGADDEDNRPTYVTNFITNHTVQATPTPEPTKKPDAQPTPTIAVVPDPGGGTDPDPNPEPTPSTTPAVVPDPGSGTDPQPSGSPDPNPDPGGGGDTDPDNPETPTPEEEASPYKADLREIFPFCIPFDLIHLLKVFDAEAEAPVFEFPLDIEMDNPWTGEKVVDYHHTFELDMADYEPVIKILRIFQVIFFIIALMLITRQQMIKG